MGMASCKDCKHYPMCGFSKYTKTPEKCLDFWDMSDVVKVVRCKDCKSYDADTLTCELLFNPCATNAAWYPEDFCSYGERKDNV